MIRNPRVYQYLVDWRKEEVSYFSGVPMDLIGMVVEYINPETWSLFHWDELWCSHLDGQMPIAFHPNGSLLTGRKGETCRLISDEGETTRLSHISMTPWVDSQGGIWRGFHGGRSIYHLNQYGINNQVDKSHRLLISAGWTVQSFIVTETKAIYLLLKKEKEFHLVGYYPTENGGRSYINLPESLRLDYSHGNLYLVTSNNQRYTLPLPEEAGVIFDPASHQMIQLEEPVLDYFNQSSYTLALTENKFFLLDGNEIVTVSLIPDKLIGCKLYCLPNGKFLVLVRKNQSSYADYSLYHLT